MNTKHVVVWIDHRQAHVIHFDAESSALQTVHSLSGNTHMHTHAGHLGSGKAPPDPRYLHAVVEALADSPEVLVVGPGSAKLEFVKHVDAHDVPFRERILGVETVDHPTDPQLLAFARQYFAKLDRLRGDQF